MTQNNLGNALSTLGERESGTARLDEGGRRLPRGAGGIDTREGCRPMGDDAEQPRQRARDARGRESGTARLEEAVAAYRAALAESDARTRAAPMGDGAEQPRQCALDARGTEEGARLEEAVPPTAPRSRKGRASGCRSTGRRAQKISASRSGLGTREAGRAAGEGGGGVGGVPAVRDGLAGGVGRGALADRRGAGRSPSARDGRRRPLPPLITGLARRPRVPLRRGSSSG